MSYYGLHIPEKTESVGSAVEENVGDTMKNAGSVCVKNDVELMKYVFLKKVDALQMLKIYKDARMREFSNIEDAVNYAQTGYEQAPNKRTDSKTCISSFEKPAFCAPTKQKLVAFRKAIESDDYEQVKSLIWENPRYLVNSGDTPTSLKDGCRYNALHVCAIYNKAEIAELILKTVSDAHFVNLLTGNKNDMKMCSELAANLLDYYLNIPEKGRLETPLHLAAKYGNVQTVKLLTSYPICKMTKNKDKKLPSQIICTRKADATKTDYIKISDLLEKRFYVPVIRSVDNDIPPQIGEPFSADNPPTLSSDPINPELKIQALAGPMKEQEAKKFCRRWKTPPRLSSATSFQINNSFSYSKPLTPLRMSQEKVIFNSPIPHATCLFDNIASTPIKRQKVWEMAESGTVVKDQRKPSIDDSPLDNQNGNGLDHELSPEMQYSEYFRSEMNNNPLEENNTPNAKSTQQKDFHDDRYLWSATSRTPNGIHSPTGYDIFEGIRNRSFACERTFCDSPGFKERNIKITDTEKGLEVIGRKLAKAQMVEWSEYWDFLDTFIDIASPEGLRKLESFLERRAREDEVAKSSQFTPNQAVIMDEVCSAFEKIGIFKDIAADVDGSANNVNLSQSTTPYTCVEKSLQVFAKRMTKTILHNIDNIDSISDAFLTELKRLKSLICSFKDDTRFLNVDFSKVHSRFAYLITIYLQNSQDVEAETKSKVQTCISCILSSPSKTQLHCVCKRIKAFIENLDKQALPEDLKTEAMCSKAWLSENDCNCQWETNLIRKSSRRNRIETRYKNYQHFQKETKETQKLKDEEEKFFSSIKKDREQSISQNCQTSTESMNNEEDEIFWSDFDGSETDEDEIWLTPPESPEEKINDKLEYNAFIYGAEPTKSDLDVLNAIFNVDININNYPNVYKWKMAVLQHTNDCFGNIRLFHATRSRLFQSHINANGSYAQFSNQSIKQRSPIAKRLFSSPTLIQKRPPLTPLNKMKGLFSTYREFLESSPISVSGSVSEIESP